MATNLNNLVAGLDPSVMPAINGSQLLQMVQEALVSSDRGILFCTDNLPTCAEITANPTWQRYLAIKTSDNPKVVYGFDATKFGALTDPPWTGIGVYPGGITNAMLAGGIQLSKLSIDPPVPADAGKYVVVNGAGSGYIHQAFVISDGSIVIAKLSITGGLPNDLIKIKSDGSAFEFISPDNLMAILSDNVINVYSLYAGGNNPEGTALFPKVLPGTDVFVRDILRAFDISADGVQVGYQIVSDGVKGIWAPRVTAGGSYFLLSHTEAQGTDGGPLTPESTDIAINWIIRTLNEESSDTGGVVSLDTVTSVFTLAAGTYRISARVVGIGVLGHTVQLWNITDGAEVTTLRCQNGFSQSDQAQTVAILSGEFTITGIKDFRLESAITDDDGGDSTVQGVANDIFGRAEYYTQLEGWKIA